MTFKKSEGHQGTYDNSREAYRKTPEEVIGILEWHIRTPGKHIRENLETSFETLRSRYKTS